MQTDRLMHQALYNLREAVSNSCALDLLPTKSAQSLSRACNEAFHAIHQFESELGPLPEWASAHNISGEPVLYAQLYTKNGRQRGNGMIFHVAGYGSFGVITDMGNTSTLNHEELLSIYEVGDFILNEEGYLKRKRQNPELDFEEPSPE